MTPTIMGTGDPTPVIRLDNGMRVVADPMPSVETVSLGVWVGVGTRDETPEINGVAHFLEHMVFKGTKRRSAAAIAKEVEAVGGHMNAYTSRENTAFYVKVLKQDVGLAVDIIADLLQNALLDPAEVERERSVVLQEIGQANDTPDDIIFDHFQETAFPDQALGRPVLGSVETVRRLSRERLETYLRGHYGGERMVLTAAGNIEPERIVGLAEEAFCNLPRIGRSRAEPARYRGGEHREDRDLEQLHLLLGFPALGYHDEDFYAESVLSTLLGGGMSSRLFQEIRENRGLVYSIYSFGSFYQDSGLFGVYAGTGPEEVGELVPVLCDELGKVRHGVTEEEVARARAQMKASLLMGLESTMARCEQAGQQILVYGRPLTVNEVLDRIEAVDAAGVERVAARLMAGPPTLAALGPTGTLESYDAIVRRLA